MGSPRSLDPPATLTQIVLTAAMKIQQPAVSELHCFRMDDVLMSIVKPNRSIQEMTKNLVIIYMASFHKNI